MLVRVTAVVAAFVLVISPAKAQQPRLAIMPFRGVGTYATPFNDFVQNLPEMLATNLSESHQVVIVERTQIDRALQNFRIEASALFDQETAQRVGNWVGATHVVLGSMTVLGGQARIDMRLVDLGQGTVVVSARVEGAQQDLFNMVNTLSSRILSAFTGETMNFQEIPRVVLDRTFSVVPERMDVPSNGAVAYPEFLYQSARPSFNVLAVVIYNRYSSNCPLYADYVVLALVGTNYNLDAFSRFDMSGALWSGQVASASAPPQPGSAQQGVVAIEGTTYTVTVQPTGQRTGPTPCPSLGGALTLAQVRIKIERAQ